MSLFCGRRCKSKGNSRLGSLFQSAKNEIKHAASDVGQGIKNVADKVGDIVDLVPKAGNTALDVVNNASKNNNNPAPQTTETNYNWLYLILGLVASAGIGLFMVFKKKKR